MSRLYLGPPGLTCALGCGLDATRAALLAGDTNGLRLEDGWLPAVTDFTDYAGVPGHPIRGLAIDLNGCGWYQVRTQDSGWLPAIRGCDAADWENGVAGDGSPITAVRVSSPGPPRVRTHG